MEYSTSAYANDSRRRLLIICMDFCKGVFQLINLTPVTSTHEKTQSKGPFFAPERLLPKQQKSPLRDADWQKRRTAERVRSEHVKIVVCFVAIFCSTMALHPPTHRTLHVSHALRLAPFNVDGCAFQLLKCQSRGELLCSTYERDATRWGDTPKLTMYRTERQAGSVGGDGGSGVVTVTAA